MRLDSASWLEPGWRGRYRVAARGHRWWGWHVTWRADKGEGVPVRKEWGGELPGGGHDASGVRAQFTRAALTLAPTTQGHRGQELVYTFGEEMTLKAVEAIKLVLDEGTACMANRTYHVHPHTGDTWHYAFPEEDGMEIKKVPTRTGPCCTPSTFCCHSYGLASHQVLHDLALSCTISRNK